MHDRIPKEIAVSATQDAARELALGRRPGLLNAVLRKVAASDERLPEGDSDRAIGVRASLPVWIVGALREAFGADVEREALALRERAALMLRPTLARGGLQAALSALEAAGLAARPAAHDMIVLEGGDPFRGEAASEGLFVAQDGSGAVVVEAVAEAAGGRLEGRRVLDLCAGRGVKATALADRGARVVAVDVSRPKLDELERVARRLGVASGIERTLALDATADGAPLAELGAFDAVLIDAPCTGLGTLRRHPEIAWRRQPADVAALAELQRRLVANGAARVAPGGGLVYAVCSFVRAEGEVSLPSPFEAVARLDLAPSSGLDAFQVRRFARRST
jgi:16S rRNA (cytosine967-C5)-methyltransferase